MDDWKLKSRCVVKLEPTPNMFISPFVHVWLISTNSQRQLMLSICRVITEFYQPLTSLNRVALIAESVESAPYLSNFKQTNCRKIAFSIHRTSHYPQHNPLNFGCRLFCPFSLALMWLFSTTWGIYLLVLTCILMSGEADVLNAHIVLPKLVESVLESNSGRCFNDMLRKLIPVPHDSLAEEHSTNTTCVPCLRQFQTVPS